MSKVRKHIIHRGNLKQIDHYQRNQGVQDPQDCFDLRFLHAFLCDLLDDSRKSWQSRLPLFAKG